MAKKKEVKLEVGMGLTYGIGSDRYAGTLIEIRKNGRELVMQYDLSYRTDNNGQSDSQTYRYERNEAGKTKEFTLRKDDRYKPKGEDCGFMHLGVRETFKDPSF